MDASPQSKASLSSYERHAWLLLLLAGVLPLFGSLVHLSSGRPVAAGLQFAKNNFGATWAELTGESPAAAASITGFVRMMAILGLAFGVLFVAMVGTSYRRGERWAWFVAWTYPAVILGFVWIATIHGGWATGEASWAGPGIAIVMVPILLGLLLPVRRFFSKAI